jgi:hypothetical protein
VLWDAGEAALVPAVRLVAAAIAVFVAEEAAADLVIPGAEVVAA